METERRKGAFSAMLQYWRHRRGLSQLDLSLTAEVSSKHVSFLETGRSRPTSEMVLRLGAALDVPRREQNLLLQAAGFESHFEESDGQGITSPAIQRAIAMMILHHEPFPLTVLDRHYHLVQANGAALRLFAHFVADPSALSPGMNVLDILFDPKGVRRFIADWDGIASMLLARLQREALARPNDHGLRDLRERLLRYPGVPESWLVPELRGDLPVVEFKLSRGDMTLRFLTTLTYFSEPRTVTTEELVIESYYPIDDETRRVCERLAADA